MINEYGKLNWLVVIGKDSVYVEAGFRVLEAAIDFVVWNIEVGNTTGENFHIIPL